MNKSNPFEFYVSLNDYDTKYINTTCDLLNSSSITNKDGICKLWWMIKKVLDEWNEKYAKFKGVSTEKTCAYFNYWFISKLKNIEEIGNAFYLLYLKWYDYVYRELKVDICTSKIYYGFTKLELINKKKLYDFLEYYATIRVILHNGKTDRKKEYCDYIWDIFKLYKEMEQKNSSQKYSEEINYFKRIFLFNVQRVNLF